jgi:hypothetical protein
MTVKGSLRDIELTDEPLANGMRVKVMMPGGLDSKPNLGAFEVQQLLTRIVEHNQGIGVSHGQARRVEDVINCEIVPLRCTKLFRYNTASIVHLRFFFTVSLTIIFATSSVKIGASVAGDQALRRKTYFRRPNLPRQVSSTISRRYRDGHVFQRTHGNLDWLAKDAVARIDSPTTVLSHQFRRNL